VKFLLEEFENVLAWCSTTKGQMDKWKPQLDSLHKNGLEIPLHKILMVVVGCCTGGEEVWAEFFNIRNWGCFR
jgi:hypothetical protein